MQSLLQVQRVLLLGTQRQDGAAMGADQQSLGSQFLEICTDGNRRNAKRIRKAVDSHPALLFEEFQDFSAALLRKQSGLLVTHLNSVYAEQKALTAGGLFLCFYERRFRSSVSDPSGFVF